MSAKYKILKKLDVRFDRYYKKHIKAKSYRSIQLWDTRMICSSMLSTLVKALLSDDTPRWRCDEVLRGLCYVMQDSDTDKAKAMLYILDDIL